MTEAGLIQNVSVGIQNVASEGDEKGTLLPGVPFLRSPAQTK